MEIHSVTETSRKKHEKHKTTQEGAITSIFLLDWIIQILNLLAYERKKKRRDRSIDSL